MPSFVKPLVSASLVLVFAACSDVAAPRTLAEAQNLWQSKNISNYSYVASIACFCSLPGPVTIEVVGGRVARVTAIATGTQLPSDGWATIDELFDQIRTAITPPTVVFDRELGYPRRIERCCMADDSGNVYTASSLLPTI